uniref:Uncharacterized protein n=1 Tax=Cyanophora sudae TaxID=1522369 RepID=A0A873WYP1_9EUKA|nr:hypothetical protein DXZ12_mgp32 [Cyanophora sudae]QPB15057.1 hypothetical protein [Cyanophora sudae]
MLINIVYILINNFYHLERQNIGILNKFNDVVILIFSTNISFLFSINLQFVEIIICSILGISAILIPIILKKKNKKKYHNYITFLVLPSALTHQQVADIYIFMDQFIMKNYKPIFLKKNMSYFRSYDKDPFILSPIQIQKIKTVQNSTNLKCTVIFLHYEFLSYISEEDYHNIILFCLNKIIASDVNNLYPSFANTKYSDLNFDFFKFIENLKTKIK